MTTTATTRLRRVQEQLFKYSDWREIFRGAGGGPRD